MQTHSKVVLITGASSGIGRAAARHLAELGYRVYGTSRGACPDTGGVTMLQMDVTDADAVSAGIQTILAREGRLDVVVNNAGFGYGGAVEETSIDEARATFETNVFGVLRVCRAALPVMRAQGAGLIVNVSSIGGLMGMPFQGLYAASKFAVEGLTETLRMEVKAFGIDVVLLEPGDIRTDFTARRRTTAEAAASDIYREQYARTLDKIAADEQGGADPQVAAKTLARILASRRPRLRYTTGPVYQKLAVFVKRIVPHALFEWVLMQNFAMKG